MTYHKAMTGSVPLCPLMFSWGRMFGSRAGAEKNNFCAILFSDMLANIILRFPWVVNQQTLTFPFVHFFFGGGEGGGTKKATATLFKAKGPQNTRAWQVQSSWFGLKYFRAIRLTLSGLGEKLNYMVKFQSRPTQPLCVCLFVRVCVCLCVSVWVGERETELKRACIYIFLL